MDSKVVIMTKKKKKNTKYLFIQALDKNLFNTNFILGISFVINNLPQQQ